MSKKVIDELENKKKKPKTNIVLLIVLILLFCFTLYITSKYVIKYNEDLKLTGNEEIIEITTKKINASIINNGFIDEQISNLNFNDEEKIVIEKENIIEIISSDNEDNTLKFNINYNILVNDFKMNAIPTNKSEVLVKFAYSFDGDEWIYINNVISTNNSNISPLIGNTYDIAGLVSNLRVVSNYELGIKNKEKTKMYWKCETIFKNIDKSETVKNFKADFTIDYKTNS